jgi:hypothetical protein
MRLWDRSVAEPQSPDDGVTDADSPYAGQKEPVLHFSHVSPIDALMKVLQQLRDYDRGVWRSPGN